MLKLSRSSSAPVCLAALRFAVGMMRRNISRIEAAKHRPTLAILERIAKALKVSFTDRFFHLTTGFDFHYWYDDWLKQHLNLERSRNEYG